MIIGIIGAMECEIDNIKCNMKIDKIIQRAGMDFNVGEFIDKHIVAVTSGIGKVNAAICTQILIDSFKVDIIINVGVAGGIDRSVELGDVVIAKELIYHDVDGSVCNYKLGQVPRLCTFSFRSDDLLVEKAFSSCNEIMDFKVHTGKIITGDQIIASTDKINFFRSEFGPHAVEMESAAIGHTCYLNNIPFIIIRAISDRADEELNQVYDDNEIIAIKNSLRVLTNLLNSL